MKRLTLIGTAGMVRVGGGIRPHGVPVAHHWGEGVSQSVGGFSWLVSGLLNAAAGIVAGAVVLAGVMGVSKLWKAVKG